MNDSVVVVASSAPFFKRKYTAEDYTYHLKNSVQRLGSTIGGLPFKSDTIPIHEHAFSSVTQKDNNIRGLLRISEQSDLDIWSPLQLIYIHAFQEFPVYLCDHSFVKIYLHDLGRLVRSLEIECYGLLLY